MEPTPLPDHYNCSSAVPCNLIASFPPTSVTSLIEAEHFLASHWSVCGRQWLGLVGPSPSANPAWFRRRKQYLVVFNLHAQGKHDIMEWVVEWCDSEPKIKPIIRHKALVSMELTPLFTLLLLSLLTITSLV